MIDMNNLMNRLKFFNLISYKLNYTFDSKTKYTWYYDFVYSALNFNIITLYTANTQLKKRLKICK